VDRSGGGHRRAALIINIATPILKVANRKLYVTLWYFSAMLVWLPLTYVMGNFVPQYFVPGAGGAAVTGLYIHDLVGLTVTPLGWGMMYYFVPVLLKKPVWSHTLSLVGFWGFAFFYPLNGVHHFFYSPIPMYAQYGAVMSTIAVEIVVFTVVVNFFMTLRGRGDLFRDQPRGALVLHRHGRLLHHLLPVRLPDHAHLPAPHPLHRLGRPRPPRHVRRVQLLDLRHDHLPLAQARRRGLVERSKLNMPGTTG
jgi:hypothetical protein